MSKVKLFITLIVGTLFIMSCDDSKLNEGVDYDRTAFLENLADNMIIPAFSDFNSKVNTLNEATLAFEAEVSKANLVVLQNALKEAWVSYQYVAYLEVGPSAEVFFREEVNIFPADTTAILSKIENADYGFTGATNNDVKGFPAVDYLVNGTGEDEASIVDFYASQNAGALRLAYLKSVVNQIKQIANDINAAWPAYRATFVGALGTDIGSSTGILVNEFNKQFDIRLKNGKIGIPSGVKSFERTNPEKVECLYGGYSKELAVVSAEAALSIFKGQSFDGSSNGEGLDDYLDALGASEDGQELSLAIINAIQLGIDQINAIDGTLYNASITYDANGDMVQAYNALQAVIPLIKVDMTSAMGVTITFQDNDGD